MSIVFVVLRCVRNPTQNYLWERAVSSIRQFYPKGRIVVIDDNSTCANPVSTDKNISVIQSEFPGAGEVLPYHYFLQHRWADKMIFLHDSMLLRRAFTSQELSMQNAFLWHFEKHTWDDDPLIVQNLELPELISYNSEKHHWWGCFGASMMVDYSTLEALEQKYGVIARSLRNIRDRKNRMTFERILAIVMFKDGYVTKERCSLNGCIHNYPYAFLPIPDKLLEMLKKTFPGPCLKVWVGR